LTSAGPAPESHPFAGVARNRIDTSIQIQILVALAGLCVGSFLNVVVARVPEGRSIVRPRSACPLCRSPIRWFDNLPLLSYLLLRGRCRHCGGRISARYPLVESLTAALFVLAATAGEPSTPLLLARLVFLSALVAVAFIDLDHLIVPDEISIPLALAGPVASAFVPDLQRGSWFQDAGSAGGGAFLASVAGAAIGAGLLALVRAAGTRLFRRSAQRQGGEAMGFGDVKLAAGLGAWTGAQGVLLAFFLAAALGALVGVANVGRLALLAGARRRARASRPRHGALAAARRFGAAIPFAPFLAAGSVAALLARDTLIRWIWPGPLASGG
jgi:leader peptidase (prepilin peptidase)/N-methyltransferase